MSDFQEQEYYVKMEFVNHPWFTTTVMAYDKADARRLAINELPDRSMIMDCIDSGTVVQLKSERNEAIRAHRKEEAETGNI